MAIHLAIRAAFETAILSVWCRALSVRFGGLSVRFRKISVGFRLLLITKWNAGLVANWIAGPGGVLKRVALEHTQGMADKLALEFPPQNSPQIIKTGFPKWISRSLEDTNLLKLRSLDFSCPFLVAQCSATPATVAATPPCSVTPFQTRISVRHLPGMGGGKVRHQNF